MRPPLARQGHRPPRLSAFGLVEPRPQGLKYRLDGRRSAGLPRVLHLATPGIIRHEGASDAADSADRMEEPTEDFWLAGWAGLRNARS
jgi:hypothetical protein